MPVVVGIVSFVCFFFKQKTAYEMRISDWSSDVCSSDLSLETVLAPMVMSTLVASPGTVAADQVPCGTTKRQLKSPIVMSGDEIATVVLDEIGRASCRERVCQYV